MKIIKAFLLVVVLVLVSACGKKLPFKAQEPLQNAALVYIYVKVSDDTSSDNYAIRINNKQTKQRIEDGEYIALNLKPMLTTLSVTKQEVIEEVLRLNLEATKTYYLKIVPDSDDGSFEFVKVEKKVGAKEIAKTGLIGTNEESLENTITELVTKNDELTTKSASIDALKTNSKTDEIQKAYDMKEKGIISEEEFQTLKKIILDKK